MAAAAWSISVATLSTARGSSVGSRQLKSRAAISNLCTTQQEDNATLTALRLGADAKLLNFDRIAILRAASNFDREGSGQTPVESLLAKPGGYAPSVTNAYRVGAKYAHTIVADWQNWSVGVPK